MQRVRFTTTKNPHKYSSSPHCLGDHNKKIALPATMPYTFSDRVPLSPAQAAEDVFSERVSPHRTSHGASGKDPHSVPRMALTVSPSSSRSPPSPCPGSVIGTATLRCLPSSCPSSVTSRQFPISAQHQAVCGQVSPRDSLRMYMLQQRPLRVSQTAVAKELTSANATCNCTVHKESCSNFQSHEQQDFSSQNFLTGGRCCNVVLSFAT